MSDLVFEVLGVSPTCGAGWVRFWASFLRRSHIQGLAHKRLSFITASGITFRGKKKIKEVHLSCFINHNRCFQFREILFKKIFLSFTIQFVFLILCYESNQKMLYWLFLYKTDHKMI